MTMNDEQSWGNGCDDNESRKIKEEGKAEEGHCLMKQSHWKMVHPVHDIDNKIGNM